MVLAFEYRGSSEDIGITVHAHPTLSEAMKEAALGVARPRDPHLSAGEMRADNTVVVRPAREEDLGAALALIDEERHRNNWLLADPGASHKCNRGTAGNTWACVGVSEVGRCVGVESMATSRELVGDCCCAGDCHGHRCSLRVGCTRHPRLHPRSSETKGARR